MPHFVEHMLPGLPLLHTHAPEAAKDLHDGFLKLQSLQHVPTTRPNVRLFVDLTYNCYFLFLILFVMLYCMLYVICSASKSFLARADGFMVQQVAKVVQRAEQDVPVTVPPEPSCPINLHIQYRHGFDLQIYSCNAIIISINYKYPKHLYDI